MDSASIYNKLKDIIKVYLPEDVSEDSIENNSHLINELNINSSHLVDIILDVEDAFDIEIKDDELEAMDTVEGAIAIIQNKIQTK